MNKIAIVAGLLALGALPAAAQNRGGFGGTLSGSSDSFGTVNFPALNSVTRQSSYPTAYGQGSFEDYEPSTYLPYDEAVKMGLEALRPKPKPSIAEVARENRARMDAAAPDESTSPAPGLRNGSSPQTAPPHTTPHQTLPVDPNGSSIIFWI